MGYTSKVSPVGTKTTAEQVALPKWEAVSPLTGEAKLAAGTWAESGPDCFAGLKSDLTSSFDTSSVIGDIRQYLTDTWAGVDSQLAPFYDDKFVSSLATYKKYLVATLKPGAVHLSQSMRINLSKEGARVNDWLKLAEQLRFPQTMLDHVPSLAEADAQYANITALAKRFDNATQVFTKAYPIDPVAIWSAAKPILDQNLNYMDSLRELATQYGLKDYSPESIKAAAGEYAPSQLSKLSQKDQVLWLLADTPGPAHDEKVAEAILAKVPSTVTLPGVVEPITAEHLSAAISALKASPGHKIQPYLEQINSPLKTATDYKAHPDAAGKKKPGYIAHLQSQLDSLGGAAPTVDVVKTADQIKVGDLVHGKAKVNGQANFGTADHPVTVSSVEKSSGSIIALKTNDPELSAYGGKLLFAPSETLTVHGGWVTAEAVETSKLVDQTTHYSLLGAALTKDQLVTFKPYVDAGDMVGGFKAVGVDFTAVDVGAQVEYAKEFPNAIDSIRAKFYELFAQAQGDDKAAQVVEVFGYKFPLGVARQIHDSWLSQIAGGPKFGMSGVDTYTSPFGFADIVINHAWTAATTGEVGSTMVFMDELGKTIKSIDQGVSTVTIAGHEFDPNVLQKVVDYWDAHPPKTWADALDSWALPPGGTLLPLQWQSDLIDAATADKTTNSILTNLMTQVRAALPKVEQTDTVTLFGHYVMPTADAKKVLAVMDDITAQNLLPGAKASFAKVDVDMPWGSTVSSPTITPLIEEAKGKYGTLTIGSTVQAELKNALAGGSTATLATVQVAGKHLTGIDAENVLKHLQESTHSDSNIQAAFDSAGVVNPYQGQYSKFLTPLTEQYKLPMGKAFQKQLEIELGMASSVPVDVFGWQVTPQQAVDALKDCVSPTTLGGGFPTIWGALGKAGADKTSEQYMGIPYSQGYAAVQKLAQSVQPVVPYGVTVIGHTFSVGDAQKLLANLKADGGADPWIHGAFDKAGIANPWMDKGYNTEDWNTANKVVGSSFAGKTLMKSLENALVGVPVAVEPVAVKVLGVTMPTDVAKKVLANLEADSSIGDPYIAGAFEKAGSHKLWNEMANGKEINAAFEGVNPGLYVKNAFKTALSGPLDLAGLAGTTEAVSVMGTQLPTSVVKEVVSQLGDMSKSLNDAFMAVTGAKSPVMTDSLTFKQAAVEALKKPLAVDAATGVPVLPGTPLIKDLLVEPGKSSVPIPNYGVPGRWWMQVSSGKAVATYADQLGLNFTGSMKSMRGWVAKAHKSGDVKLLQYLITKLPAYGGDAIEPAVSLPGGVKFTYDQLDGLGLARFGGYEDTAKGSGTDLIQSLKNFGVDTKTIFKTSTTKRNVLKKMKPYVDQVVQPEIAFDPLVTFSAPSLPSELATWSIDPSMPVITSGTHPIYPLMGAGGNRWLFKQMPEAWRGDIEQAALKVGKLLGFTEPDAAIASMPKAMENIGGQTGLVQRFVTNGGTLHGVSPGELTDQQIQDVAREHVLDWLTSNDDGHDNNFLRLPNGSIMGIDKGRSFKWFGNPEKDQLKLGMLDNNAHTYYTDLYAYLASPDGKGKLDMAYTATVRRARQAQTVPDQSLIDIIDPAFEKRPNFEGTGATTKSQLVQMVVDRKNSLESDINQLYDQIYKNAGLVKPDVPFSPLGDGTYTELTHELLGDLNKVGSYGIPHFVSGTDFEDGMALWWKELDPKGAPLLLGEFKLREDADGRLMNWLKANHGESISGSAAVSMVPKLPNEQAWYDDIIQGAKTFSYHVEDKQYNPKRVAMFESAKTGLDAQLKSIESGALTNVDMGLSEVDFQSYKKMIETYKQHVAFVENARDNGIKTKAVDLPQFEFVPAPVDTPMAKTNIIVTPSAVYRDQGKFDSVTGLVTQTGHKVNDGGAQGYRIQLPNDNAVIEYVPWSSPNMTQQGMLTVHVQGDAQFESAKKALDQLGIMGIPITASSEQDMELFYWRSLWGKLTTHNASGPKQAVYEDIRGVGQVIKGGPPLSPDEELAKWRAAWSQVTSVDQVNEFVATKGFLPQFSHTIPGQPGMGVAGKPYWNRFDVSSDTLKDSEFIIASLHDESDLPAIVKSGGMFSTEERLRLLGDWMSGQSSGGDQGYGSAAFTFTRQNSEKSGSSIYINPKVMARTSTYSYEDDLWGKLVQRDHAPFDVQEALKMNTDGYHSSNETMVKNSISLMDDLEVLKATSDQQREEIISYLHSIGITEIRGLPVEDRIVTSHNVPAALEKAHKAWKDAGSPIWN